MAGAVETYTHSGKIPPQGALLAVGGTLVGASVAGWLYTEFICGIPWIYVNVIAVAVFGFVVGAIASWLTRLGKIRNPGFSALLGICAAFVGLYVAWGHDVTVRGLYEDAPFSLSPGHVWAYVQAFNADGGWMINGTVPTGYALWAIWLIETTIVVLVAWAGSNDALGSAICCEPCGRWTKLDPEVRRMTRDTSDWLRVELFKGNSDVLLGEMGAPRAGNYVRVDLNTCGGCFESNYATLVGVRVTTTKDGDGGHTETTSETTLELPVRIPARVAKAFREATPAWVESGLEETHAGLARKESKGQRDRERSKGQRRDRKAESRGQRRDRKEESRGQRRDRKEESHGQRRDRKEESHGQRRDRKEESRGQRRDRKAESHGQRRDRTEESRTRTEARPKARRRKKLSRRNLDSGVILLHCPHCDAETRIPSGYAGKRGKCPRCHGEVRVPER